MNNLRVPVALLILVIIAIGAWLLLGHPHAAAQTPTTDVVAASSSQTAAAQPQTTPPDLDTVASGISGVWQSTDDQNYSVTITPDSKWTDTYKQSGPSGDITESGTYTFFTSDDPDPDYTGTVAPGVVYIKLVEGKDTYFYSVLAVSDTNLQLSYLARGNTLSFVKAQ